MEELSDEIIVQTAPELITYKHDEAVEAATKYFNGDEMAAVVWVNKYALKNSEGELFELTPNDMHHRIAKELSRIEKKYANPVSEEELFEAIKEFKYILPQGSPMAGIGNEMQIGSLSNCFVIGNDGESDSYGGIMKIDQEQVQLMKRRGGVGHDLSGIRPKGSPVKNSALTSTGIVPFMERYSNSTREVAQDGRRGALMLSISVKHPDSEMFIDAKMDSTKVTGANVSVKITDDFMESIINKRNFTQQYPIDSKEPKYTKTIEPSQLWNKIVHNAWKSAEPGILFWDTIIRESVPDSYADLGFKTISTNPCGEIPLCAYDSCRLLAINLYSYIQNPFTENAKFDAHLFQKHIHLAQRIMDDIIDLEQEKIDKIIAKIDSDPEIEELKLVERNLWTNIKKKTELGRRTGIGITAEGDMLAALGLKYGSDEAVEFSVDVHKYLAIEAYKSSVNLAKDRGAFPIFNYEREKNNPFMRRIWDNSPGLEMEMKKYGRRNISLLTIAPTGTTSMMSQTSSGIEPVFMVSYSRNRKVNPNDKSTNISFVDEIGDSWETYNVFHHKFVTWLEANNYDTEAVKLMNNEDLNKIIEKSPYFGATANDVDWLAKVRMQGAVQKWVDHSISVTVNVPETADEELIGKIYQEAWKSGCKGMTVYRDGSRSGVLVAKVDAPQSDDDDFKVTTAPKRPQSLEAEVVRFQNNKEKWIAIVGLYKGHPYEIFSGKSEDLIIPSYVNQGNIVKHKNNKNQTTYDFEYVDKGGITQEYRGLSRAFDKEFWNYAKLISGILRHGMPIPFVVDLVNNLHFENDTINTWKAGIVRAIKKFVPDGTVDEKNVCPECGKTSLVYKEGCLICSSCGYSKCG
ncbi:MAG: ribonucleoside-diphosphate reductase, adenosylcobalamin-dependent [Bacteroidetes bacterium CG2_30_33_31]|nr:MAG: ribonucleoside-diphosphate reductase, adenosylcobalamin-dependent [Bacteroidetes bacterium CG2_30_33_31]